MRSITRLCRIALDVALLRWREIVIEENQVGIGGSGRAGDLLQLAAADQRGRIGPVAPLQNFADDFGACAGRQRAQLVQRFFRAEFRNRGALVPADTLAPRRASLRARVASLGARSRATHS